MKIACFSTFLNHHNSTVADELYKQTGGNYVFVETTPMPKSLLKSGYPDCSSKPYLLQTWKGEKELKEAKKLALEADVALFAGHEVLEYEKLRLSKTNKLSFDISERWLKRDLINLLSPRIFKMFLSYHFGRWNKKNIYKLCSSSFGAKDHKLLRMYKNKCFKWGYFTKANDYVNEIFTKSFLNKQDTETIAIMWCSRFIKWKHSELPIIMAKRLKDKNYKFILNMYGSGVLLERSKKLASSLDLDDVVHFCGNVPNDTILQIMRQHEIFLFTSDSREGWGAVANESMSNGCVVVGSNAIGSIPFLVKNGVNGLIFKSSSRSFGFQKNKIKYDKQALDSLCEKVEWLLNNPNERKKMSYEAYKTMTKIWSPTKAASNLLQLINDLQNGKESSIKEGPCSKAL